jgi:hypothetical protein
LTTVFASPFFFSTNDILILQDEGHIFTIPYLQGITTIFGLSAMFYERGKQYLGIHVHIYICFIVKNFNPLLLSSPCLDHHVLTIDHSIRSARNFSLDVSSELTLWRWARPFVAESEKLGAWSGSRQSLQAFA